MKIPLIVSLAVLLVAPLGNWVLAGGRGDAGMGPACGYQLVERTIQVPTMVTERRVINVTECRIEMRERPITVQKVIPETRQVRDVYTVMVPLTETRTETYHVRVPVWREVVEDVTVQIPSRELRQGTRRVCRPVQVQEMQCVTRDRGHWEDVLVECDCGVASTYHGYRGYGNWAGVSPYGAGYDAGSAPAVTQQVQRVWKPEIVTEQEPVMVWRTETVDEPYEYYVTLYHPEVRQQKTKVCDFVTEEKQQEVQVTVCVPQKREAVRNVTSYRTVAESQIQRFTVRVPHTVQKEVEVQVCRLVPKTVVCRVPVNRCP